MNRLLIRPEADRDTDFVFDYFARVANVDVALRFLNALSEGYERLQEHPHVGTRVKSFDPRLPELRFWPVPGFETYLIFYQAVAGAIDVVRVLHGVQDLERTLGESTRG